MSNGWTPDRRAKHSQAIQRWKPWLQATGPKSPEGKAMVAKNAYKGRRRPVLRAAIRALKLAMRLQTRFIETLDG